MKIKHWAGYGCVEGVCIARGKDCVTVELWGNHEQGLKPRYFDARDWDRWLGTRFKVGRFDKVDCIEWWSERDKKDHMEVTFWKEA